MRFVIDSRNSRSLFDLANYSPEIDQSAGFQRRVLRWDKQGRLGQQDLADGICHAYKIWRIARSRNRRNAK